MHFVRFENGRKSVFFVTRDLCLSFSISLYLYFSFSELVCRSFTHNNTLVILIKSSSSLFHVPMIYLLHSNVSFFFTQFMPFPFSLFEFFFFLFLSLTQLLTQNRCSAPMHRYSHLTFGTTLLFFDAFCLFWRLLCCCNR